MANKNPKIVDAFLGMASKATESWQNNLNELVAKGKISSEEGSKLLKSVEERMEAEKEKYDNFTKKMFTSIKKKVTSSDDKKPSKSPEIQLLEERIKVLELKMTLIVRELITLKASLKKEETGTQKPKE